MAFVAVRPCQLRKSCYRSSNPRAALPMQTASSQWHDTLWAQGQCPWCPPSPCSSSHTVGHWSTLCLAGCAAESPHASDSTGVAARATGPASGKGTLQCGYCQAHQVLPDFCHEAGTASPSLSSKPQCSLCWEKERGENQLKKGRNGLKSVNTILHFPLRHTPA